MTADILKLHQGVPADDIAATLRQLADDIEAGERGVVTTAIVCLGHTLADFKEDGMVVSGYDADTFAFGPRADVFTVRGLMVTCLKEV